MTFEEFIAFRDVKIRDSNHEKIVKMFFGYLESITGNNQLLPNLIGQLLDIDLSSITVASGCFNGIFDGTEPPYNDVDFYIRLNNDIKIFIYGSLRGHIEKELKDNEYVIIIIKDNLSGNIIRKPSRYIYIT